MVASEWCQPSALVQIKHWHTASSRRAQHERSKRSLGDCNSDAPALTSASRIPARLPNDRVELMLVTLLAPGRMVTVRGIKAIVVTAENGSVLLAP
eukprot:160412-Amphidinium_carterae.1